LYDHEAFDEAQVRPLLPANARSIVLVTGRRPMNGLDAAERIQGSTCCWPRTPAPC
jgi:hypothetical protein